ncbi:hypothetical protein AZ019_005377, partial [Klebsiella pneumoniae]
MHRQVNGRLQVNYRKAKPWRG